MSAIDTKTSKDKWKCQECGNISYSYLITENPFDTLDQICGCVKCFSAQCLQVACYYEGCSREASNGMHDSSKTYVWSCFEHAPNKTGE